jgi:hypothetical protein
MSDSTDSSEVMKFSGEKRVPPLVPSTPCRTKEERARENLIFLHSK